MTDPASNMNKAHAAAGSVVVAEAVAQLVIQVVKAKWPTFIDDITAQSISTIIVALVTWGTVYLTPGASQ